MSGKAENGVVSVPCTGVKTFLFPCAPGLPVRLDVIKTASQYWDVWRRHESAEGKVPPENVTALRADQLQFVAELLQEAAKEQNAPDPRLDDTAQAMAFLKLLVEEEAKLRDFFVPGTPEDSSSPQSTKLIFSD